MATIHLNSVGVRGDIKVSQKRKKSILSDPFTFHYIPDCRIVQEKGEVSIIEDPSLDAPAVIEYPVARLASTCDDQSYVVMCEYLMERKRQEKKGICSISSSSVFNEHGGIVFFGGATNLGKSSCALELSKNGFDLFSDEKTLINLRNKTMEGGSRGVPLRKEVIRKKFDTKKDYEKIEYDLSKKPPIRMIVLPHLDRGVDAPIIERFESLDLFWNLTKEFSRRIRGNTKFINYYEYLLPSLDTDELAQERISLTKDFSRAVKAYYFQGNLEQLVAFVKEKFK